MKLAGIILILVGIIALVYQGFTYTKPEHAQLGPLTATYDSTHYVAVPSIIGAAIIVGGVACLVIGSRRS